MVFQSGIKDFLKGEAFSNGLTVVIGKKEKQVVSRFQIIEELIEGKNVIHMGCCDHIPLIRKKIAQNLWLHKRICEKACKCVGIDIDQAAVSFVQNELGIKDIVCADILGDQIEAIKKETWD